MANGDAKTCLFCHSEFVPSSNSHKYCSSVCRENYYVLLKGRKRKYGEHEVPKPKPQGDCPMLEVCRKVTGIDCKGRDYEECNFYRLLLSEKEGKKGGYFNPHSERQARNF